MSIDSIVSSFRELSPEEKIRLLQELWDQTAQEIGQMPLTESQRRLLDERLADEEDNPDDIGPWTDVKDDILRDL